jgi:hypothetical protein
VHCTSCTSCTCIGQVSLHCAHPFPSTPPHRCKDIDDALHVRQLPNGNLELGVHIADVTRFLAPGTAMDEEVRGETVWWCCLMVVLVVSDGGAGGV